MTGRVLVNGFGIIGKRVAWGVKQQDDMELAGIADIGITPSVRNFIGNHGALSGVKLFGSTPEGAEQMEKEGFKVQSSLQEALESGKFDVVVDATPGGIEVKNKELYEKAGVKAIYQGGAKEDIAEVSFNADTNYSDSVGKSSTRVVSCNTTSLARTLNALNKTVGVSEAFVVLVRRAVDPVNDKKGPVDAMVPETHFPSHHGPDVQTVMPELNISTMATKVPTTLAHTHYVTTKVNGDITAEKVKELFSNTNRVMLFSGEQGYKSTAAIMEFFRDINRPRSDMYEAAVWEDSITVKDGKVYWIHAVHSEAIVLPENIDAIRAVCGIEKDKEKSIQKTNKSLGVINGAPV